MQASADIIQRDHIEAPQFNSVYGASEGCFGLCRKVSLCCDRKSKLRGWWSSSCVRRLTRALPLTPNAQTTRPTT